MGTRINKTIGYGLTDLKCRYGAALKDPRINPDGYLGVSTDTQEAKWSSKGYLKFLDDLTENAPSHSDYYNRLDSLNTKFERVQFKVATKTESWEPYNSVKHDSEFGSPKVLLICPPEQLQTWHQHDSSIDYYEEILSKRRGMKARARLLPHGAYPYEGSYQDDRTGKRIVGETVSFIARDIMDEKQYIACEDLNRDAIKLGFKDAGDLVHLTPFVPNSVYYLCKYLKLFKDEATIWTLKPMLYTYWS